MADDAVIPSHGATVLAIAFTVIMLFGGLSNAVVILTHITERQKLLKESKDILVFSLAIADLIMTSLVVPFGLSSAVAQRWTTGKIGCVWYGFITTWVGLSCILQLSLIAVERVYTLSSAELKSMSRARTGQLLLAAWLISFFTSCFPLFGWSEYTYEGFGLHCSIVWSMEHRKYAYYCFFLLIFFYAVPLFAIGFSYAKVFRVVRRMYRNAVTMWGADSTSTRQSYVAQVKVTKQIVVITAGFLIAWTPYAIMSLLKTYFNVKLPHGYYEIPPLFTKTANIYNPVIYFFMYRRLRVLALKTIKKFYGKLL